MLTRADIEQWYDARRIMFFDDRVRILDTIMFLMRQRGEDKLPHVPKLPEAK